MKANIDLTLNRDFRKDKNTLSVRDILLVSFGKFPWRTLQNSNRINGIQI